MPDPHIDLLLEGVQRRAPHRVPDRLIDAPKVETSAETNGGFDWKPTVLLVVVCAAALAAFAYL